VQTSGRTAAAKHFSTRWLPPKSAANPAQRPCSARSSRPFCLPDAAPATRASKTLDPPGSLPTRSASSGGSDDTLLANC